MFHEQTKHSYISVRKNPNFLDWRTQPKSSKSYPHFYQRFEMPTELNLIGGITAQKRDYYLRSVPSAGALYPNEVYVQARGVKGLLEGIYHYEPLKSKLTLLNEIGSDGVEFYMNLPRQKGLIFLVSAIYFRSAWKYGNRSIRYIFLDSGHQLGAIYAALALNQQEATIHFNFDKLAANEAFGFRDDEMFTVALSASTSSDKEVMALKQKVPFVSGCDYLESNKFIEEAYCKSAKVETKPIVPNFFKDTHALKDAIIARRSIRAFYQQSITHEEFGFIFEDIFEFAKTHGIDIFYTAHLVEGMTQGLYHYKSLLKEGDFAQKSGYLALEQNLGAQSAVTLYFASDENYQKANILSGFLAHILYLKAQIKAVGCSGIGAYYDDEVKAFLGTKKRILYMLAIGR